LLQTAEDLQAAAQFNDAIEIIVDKYGPLSKERTTDELCVLTKWRGFDEEESTEEPFFDKWIDTPVYSRTTYCYWRTRGMSWPFRASQNLRSGKTTLAMTSRAPLATPTPTAMIMVRHVSSISNYLIF
jgi:hypothetical protein